MDEYAWISLVMLDNRYAKGVVVLAASLRDAKTKYPVWCMVTPDVTADTRQMLQKHVDKLIDVPMISALTAPLASKKQNMMYWPWIMHSYTKWNIFDERLIPAKKLVFVDADAVCLENCDELFDMEAPAMTFASPWAYPNTNNKITENPYAINGQDPPHGAEISPAVIASAIASKRSCMVGLGCLVVAEPRYEIFAAAKNKLDGVYGNTKCINGPDEQLLCDAISSLGITPRHISTQYNCVVGKRAQAKPVKMHQFYGVKPWCREPVYPDEFDWWNRVDKLDAETAAWIRESAILD